MLECPICGAWEAYHFCSIKLKGSRSGKYNPLYYCGECESFFQRPDYREDDEALKGDLQWHLINEREHRNRTKNVLDRVLQIHPEAKTLLDIGCGIGTTILLSRERGLTAYGVEPNPYAVRYAEEKSALNLQQAYFRADLFNTKMDIVIVDNVLEHIPAPRDFIREVFTVLSRNGILYLAVPDRRGGFLRIIYSVLCPPGRFSLFSDNDVHINHFSRKSILKLIEPYNATLRIELRPGAYIIQAKA